MHWTQTQTVLYHSEKMLTENIKLKMFKVFFFIIIYEKK